ncbi:MAG TPA: carboxypeptidase-like regulatory domain-containing protein [Bacteroidia bacterium]|nr:carboxypeptidase-like regulatory domain-containing protein [Bacteroidia bacterium]
MKRALSIVFVLLTLASFAQRKYTITGTVFEGDSTTVMPYVYLINQSNGNGTITDYNGHFTIIAKNADTLVFSYLGYARKKYPVSLIKNINDSIKRPLKIVMQRIMVDLAPVTAFTYKIKQNEIDYMKRYIKQHAATKGLSALQSPITALYDQFSKKGRENRKLQQIFERILIQEEVDKKFNPEILRQLTEDEFIDFNAFRRYCWYVNDQYIISHEGYELYAPIMDCYKRWKADGK